MFSVSMPSSSGVNAGRSPHREWGGAASPFQVIARVILVATLCAAPWAYGAVLPWGWGAMTALAFLALVLWALGCAQRGVLNIAWSPLYWPFLAFLLLAVVQFFAGLTIDRVSTRESLLKIVTDLVLFFLAGQLLNAQPENGRALGRLGLVVMLEAFALSVLALAQFLTSPGVIYWRVRPAVGWAFGPYVNHNHFAGLMEMLIPISAACLLSRPPRSSARSVLWILLVLPLVSVLFSGSRAAAGVLLVEGLLLALLVASKSHREVRKGAIVWGCVVAGAALGMVLWINSGHLPGRIMAVFQPDKYLREEVSDRVQLAKTAIRIVESHPNIGVGLGCFEYAFPEYATFVTNMHWTHVHDDYLEILTEVGLPGGLILVVALVFFFRLGFRHLEERFRHESGWIQVGATVACVGLLFHSFLDFNLRISANAAWFVVCLAIAVHPRSSPGNVQKVIRVSNPERNGGFLN
jgi:O-antigen ligase